MPAAFWRNIWQPERIPAAMGLDIATLVVLTSVNSLIAAIAIGMLWLVHGRYPGVGHWTAGAFSVFAGGLIIVARSVLPELVSLVAGNIIIIAGYALVLRGLNLFTRQPRQPILEIGAVVAIGLGQSCLGLIDAPLAARIVLLTTFWTVLSAAMAQRFFAYGRTEPAMASVCLLGGSIVTVHALFTGTIAALVAFGGPTPGPLEPNPVRAATYFEASLIIMLLALSLILLVTRRLEIDLGRLAAFDELTGCYTRRAFLAECSRELARIDRDGGHCAVVMFDADHFKAINDGHGHHAGDAVLAEIARRASVCLGPQDRLGRQGGEEFCALLADAGPDRAAAAAERLRRTVAETPIEVGDARIAVTISLGVAVSPDHATDIAGLLKAADAALYRAKHGGRNRTEIALPAAA